MSVHAINSLPAAAGQYHALVDEEGDVFYPDGPEDAGHFADLYEAEPVYGPRARALAGQHVLCQRWPCSACTGRG